MTIVKAKQRIQQAHVSETEIPDSQNPRYLFCGINTNILTAIVKGEIDPLELAKKELGYRGLNENGAFIGWK